MGRYYSSACRHQHAAAQANLGALYYNGVGVPKDYKTAAELFRQAASSGHAGAQRNLGVALYYGHGVAKDEGAALDWLGKASEQVNFVGCVYSSDRALKFQVGFN